MPPLIYPPTRDWVAMCCWPFDKRKSPLAPPFDSAQGMLFQRGVLLWDPEELDWLQEIPPFFKEG